MPGDSKDISWAWERHWQAGNLSSLSKGNESRESEEGRTAWNNFFSELPKGAKLLDLCTGNGAIPALAMAFSKETGADFQITGVDMAQIDPHATVTESQELLEGITFQGGVNVEELPFEDASFDAIIGQYAIEYSNVEKTVPGIFRVLKNGGRCRFVVHAREGTIVTFNSPKARQYEHVLKHSGLLEALSEAIRLAYDVEAGGGPEVQEQALQARTKLRDVAVATRAKVLEIENIDEPLTLIENLVRAYITRKQFENYVGFEEWLAGIRTQIQGQVEMIKSFKEVAISRGGLSDLARLFEETGFSDVKTGEVRIEEAHLQGWTIEAMKP